MKKVTLRVKDHADFDKVLVKVETQTHSGYNFGNDPRDLRLFRASNGIVLGSNSHPAKDADNKNYIWLRGYNYAKKDNTIVLTREKARKVVAAVEEYNRTFAAPAPVRLFDGSYLVS